MRISKLHITYYDFLIAMLSAFALFATILSYKYGYMLLYGDAESHLNIAKRVTSSITPGFAQLGGIWLPLPHILMIPLTYFDTLWRTGLAGAIISGIAYVIAGLYLYKIIFLITQSRLASTSGMLVFALNPNILYLSTTAMTELTLIAFFILSTYHFIHFLQDDRKVEYLIYAAFFGLCATLSRYDGWFLVLTQAALLIIFYIRNMFVVSFKIAKKLEIRISAYEQKTVSIWHILEGKFLMYSVLAFLGMGLWLLWNWLILSDPFYFINSPFSAKSQQQGWLGKGELPAYHDLFLSFVYYSITSIVNIGYAISALAVSGFITFLMDKKQKERYYLTVLFFVPFFFYIITLYQGQSVIFIPELTPSYFSWNLFNARYGVMMVPAAALAIGYLLGEILKYPFQKQVTGNVQSLIKVSLVALFAFFISWQTIRFIDGTEYVISYKDASEGLSSAKVKDAQYWLNNNYDNGLIVMDDYARTLSIIKSGIPMQNVIYIGNKPYWENALNNPEQEVKWIIMQKNDAVWNALYENGEKQGRLYKYYEKAYTSPEILIFKRNSTGLAAK